jgi:phosphate-selective porin OprO/OprP
MKCPHLWRTTAGGLLLAGGWVVMSGITASAQVPLPTPPAPTLPAATPSNEEIADAATSREAQLEERVRRLEALLSGQLANTSSAATQPGTNGIPGTAGTATGRDGPNVPVPGATNPNATYPRSSGALAPGQGTPAVPAPSDKYNMPAKAYNFPLKARFGPGFEFRTDDDEYVLQFHNLSQFEFRGYQQGGQQPVKDTFDIPRQWFMFSGRLTKPLEFFVSLQHGFDNVSLLDNFLNIHYDDRLQFKLGRYKTPFTYEFYALPIQGLIQPERSLFFNNLGLNRELGITVWGQLFEKRLDYAAAILNTARNGFVDNNDSKNFSGFLNWRPFLKDEGSLLQFLNFGGSVLTGSVINPVNPQTFRTVVATSGNAVFGVPFLGFNSNAREDGLRTFWDAHAALYRNSFSLIGEWQSGSQQYGLANNLSQRTRIPVESFYVQAGYFVTGETVSGRNVVNPLKNFDLRPGRRGLGAVELTARYNYLTLGPQVFSGGFADPNQWARSLYTTDAGVNWSWTQNIKWIFNWEHAVFGTPVVYAPGRLQKTSDLFMARLQVFF